jgi:hypothetical protein
MKVYKALARAINARKLGYDGEVSKKNAMFAAILLFDDLKNARDEIERLRAELSFYANDGAYVTWSNTNPGKITQSLIMQDRGKKAREALKDGE